MYIRSGHADSVGDEPQLSPLPFVDHPELPPVAQAQVSGVGIHAPNLVLELLFGEFVSRFVYAFPECPPFVVPVAHFARSLAFARTLTPGDIVDVFFADGATVERHHGRVLAPPALEPDPYNSIVVEFTDDQSIGRLQPWEIIFPEEPGPAECAVMRMCATLGETIEKVVEEADKQIRSCRSERALTACIHRAEAPMDLALIVERLKKNYYATAQSVLADVLQLEKVAAVVGTGIAAARAAIATLTPMIRFAAEKEGLIVPGLSTDDEQCSSSSSSTSEYS
jgi:hypothetical protein